MAGAPGELSEREAAVHVLNRLGYGPRPGDVERVLAIGVDAYIEAQLRPAGVTENPTLERRLASYAATAMTQAELLDKYPLPQRMRREMRMSGGEIDTAALRRAARASYAPVRELGQARQARYAFDDEEQVLGMRCVAAVIYDEYAYPLAAISLSGPTARITDRRVEGLGLLAARAADEVTHKIGGRRAS